MIKIGSFFLQKKNFFKALCIIFLPLFITTGYVIHQYYSLKQTQEKINHLIEFSNEVFLKRVAKEKFLSLHENSSPTFIEEQLEPLTFLAKEKDSLNKISSHPAFTNNALLQSRLQKISSNTNKLSFRQESVLKTAQVIESEENLTQIIELDYSELCNLIHLIEKAYIKGKPQFLIKEIEVKASNSNLNNQTLHLTKLNLIKREFKKR